MHGLYKGVCTFVKKKKIRRRRRRKKTASSFLKWHLGFSNCSEKEYRKVWQRVG
jgi:hypothetical protein